MENKLICSACEADLAQGARYCAQCGVAVERTCPGCSQPAEASARFCPSCGTSLAAAQAPKDLPSTPSSTTAGSADNASTLDSSGERRHLTVMFCDLEASAELAERIDEEDLRNLVRRYYDLCERIIKRYDGHVANYIGDGVLVYFGYPTAHEDDPEGAVRASLDIITDMKELAKNAETGSAGPLGVRIGIHTGPVIVGDLGSGVQREGTALGETMNLAARLNAVAKPNTVVISGQTQRLVRGIFVMHDLGPQSLKGISEPVQAYGVVQASGIRSQLEAATRHFSPFVGRDLEIGLLLDRWEKTEEGQGQAVLVTGEAGIGKSRLAMAMRERMPDHPHTWLECMGSRYTQNTAFHPIIELVEQGLAFTANDTPEAKLRKLEQAVQRAGFDPRHAVPLFASFLKIPLGDAYQPLDIGPDLRRRKTLDALVSWLLALGELQPLIVIVEDLQWCDPSSLDLLSMIIERNAASRVLLVMVARPEFKAPWGERSHLTPIKVTNMNKRQTREIAQGLSPECRLPGQVLETIIERSGGIPLYIEELTQMVLESKILRKEYGKYVLQGSLRDLAIPDTLQDSLMARLDRMSEAKEVAQMASVLGREFSYSILAEISQKEDHALLDNLERLVKSEVLYQRGVPPDAVYSFKHTLIQDAAYQSMVKSVRQQLHQRTARSLEEKFPHIGETKPEVLARHLEGAGAVDRAVSFFQQAGEQEQERSAYKEEMGHFERALELLSFLPKTEERELRELQLQIAAGHARSIVLGYDNDLTMKTYHRARELGDRVGEARQRVIVYNGLALANSMGEDPAQGEVFAQNALDIARESGDVRLQLVGYRAIALAAFFLGKYQAAKKHCAEALALYAKSQERWVADAPGANEVVTAYYYSGLANHSLGYVDLALEKMDEAEEFARAMKDPLSICTTLMFRAAINYQIGRFEASRTDALEAIDLGDKNGVVTIATSTRIGLPAFDFALGLLPDPAPAIMESLAGLGQGAPKAGVSIILSIASNALIKSGNLDMAKNMLDMALGISASTGHASWKPELLRLRGEVALASPDGSQSAAENYYWQAIELARDQDAKFWELRSTLSLARLQKERGEGEEAAALLRPIYEWFTEGFDTADMQEAKAMLEGVTAQETA